MYFCPVLKNLSVWLCAAAALVACGNAERSGQEPILWDGVSFQEMPIEPLPALNVPRMAHSLFLTGEEMLVVGGHTTGFIPTRTAEYFSGGKWHLVDLHYIHDSGFAVTGGGKPFVGGGYDSDFGIGQSWGTEQYDPSTHTFTHLPIMDRKRTHASALELEDGSVLISGNWYAQDGMELYTPGEGFRFVKDVAQHRSSPFILKSAPDNALVFASWGYYGDSLKPIVIDRLHGEPFTVPLLEEWFPSPPHHGLQPAYFEVGNYSYLIPVENARGQLAPMLVSGEQFSLLETQESIPMEGPWGHIRYDMQFFTDKETGTAWLLGTDIGDRVYLLKMNYLEALRGKKAPLCVYYTRPVENLYWAPSSHAQRDPNGYVEPRGLLLPGGRMALVGGAGGHSQYDPTPVACILHPGGTLRKAGIPWWVIALVLSAFAGLFLWWRLRKKPEISLSGTDIPAEDLHSRLVDLMENKQFFLRKDAKLSHVATELGTNITYVSAVVNGTTGMSFPSFLNGYRVRYAQKLMREHPEMPLKTVADESGFPNETTFFRNFKAQTGLTPSEWKVNEGL